MKHLTSSNEQIGWDSTSIRAALKCPRYYQYSILEGLKSPSETRAALEFGIMFHSAMEFHEKNKRDIRKTFKYTLQISSGWETSDTARGRKQLLILVVWYCLNYLNDTAVTHIFPDGTVAIEMSFQIPQFKYNNLDILLCGHIDRIVSFNDKMYVADFKTTKRMQTESYYAQFTNDVQMTCYTVGLDHLVNENVGRGAIIDSAQILVSGARFGRFIAERTEEMKEEFIKQTLPQLVAQMHAYANRGYFPMNQISCHNYGIPCEYLPICTAKDSLKSAVKSNQYQEIFWQPMEKR